MSLDHLLLEDGGYLELEGGTTHLILESSTTLEHIIVAIIKALIFRKRR